MSLQHANANATIKKKNLEDIAGDTEIREHKGLAVLLQPLLEKKKMQVDNNLLEMSAARTINELNLLSPQYPISSFIDPVGAISMVWSFT